MNASWWSAVCVAGLPVSGCSARVGGFTALSMRNVKLAGKRSSMTVRGERCDRVLLGCTLERKDMTKAVERALEAAGPDDDARVDATVDSTWFSVRTCGSNRTVVEGVAVTSTEP